MKRSTSVARDIYHERDLLGQIKYTEKIYNVKHGYD